MAKACKPVVALQLYTVRNEVEADYPGTLKKVARMGYPAVQAGPTAKYDAKAVRRMMDDLDLESAGVHVGLDQLQNEFNATVDMIKDMRDEWAIVAWLPEDRRRTGAQWRQVARLMTRLGARLKAEGIRLAYHNHSFEFHTFGGRYGYDLFFDTVDSNLVHNEIDTYWIKHGNEDPVAYLKRYAGHIQIVHFKDMGRGPDRPMVPVGEGILDWPAIIAACRKGGTRWICIEQDTCDPLTPMRAAKVSLDNCRKWGLL